MASLRGRPSAYTSAALEREVAAVLTALPGTSNHTPYNAAYALGRHVGDGRLPGYQILAAVPGGIDRGITP